MAPYKKVLMLCGDYMEDYEAAVPLHALAALGVAVDCAAPGKRPGDACLTAVHEFLGFELYTELPGHRFAVTSDFAAAAADPSRYDALIVPGGRFVEQLSTDDAAVRLVAAFAALRRPVVLTCHSQLLLAAAGAIGGVRCTAFFSMKPVVELAGGKWVDPDPFSLCVADGHVLTAIGWPAHAEIIRELLAGMGARVHGGRGQAILILSADYVDDYEANVPFRALAGVGCRVEAACPTKRKGESCVTAIYDAPAGSAVSEERRGHNFVVTADWADVSADDYDCVVVPGGRSPELLVTHEKAVALVREFADKGKVVAGIDQGHLLLAAAGLLKGKKCASGVPMRVISRLAGAEAVEPEGAVADGKLVTAASWPDLTQFVAHLVDLLGITVSF
ncbi:DJ-1 protein homolog E-like [Phragmites australis]|uniref:DJ-1 protein homolog E-like n=1 Tax=Phragmites australis TaxID=29695 RepID=UPI002D7821D0|nr:DJ-1 protein homolog E-like [Phragmites australis]